MGGRPKVFPSIYPIYPIFAVKILAPPIQLHTAAMLQLFPWPFQPWPGFCWCFFWSLLRESWEIAVLYWLCKYYVGIGISIMYTYVYIYNNVYNVHNMYLKEQ